MLERLELQDVGPAASMRIDLAPRLNVLAGDNGVGKTFVLDVAWWALTGTWAGYEAAPHRTEGAHPALRWADRRNGQSYEIESAFRFDEQQWDTRYASPEAAAHPTPVLYVRVDGGFSIWDPLRAAGKSAFRFSPDEVWSGQVGADASRTVLCNGLLRDWATWQLQRGAAFETLTRVLEILSPGAGETVRPGASTTRVSLHDVRDIPTLDLSYGTVPVVHASAGMKHVLALAYLLVWTWREHVEAGKLRGTAPSKSLVLVFDEVEAHLHPQWQRVILPALLRAVRELSPEIEVQILATTHAPMVLASLEPHFDEAKDALFHFDLEDRKVIVQKIPWRPRGDASAWLTSEVFGLGEARSPEAEAAIQSAREAMLRPDLPIEEARRIHHELHAVLKDTDPFWPRWLVRARQAGVAP
jgi:hypothetical protein